MRNRTISGPPDGGWGWMCVAGKLYCCLCILGSPAAFGIIYIELIDYFNTTREVAAWIGSLSFGLTFLTGPLSSALISRFGIQKTSAAGILIAFLGCFISWFANGIPYLYFSYGVLTGIGFGIAFVPCMLIVVQYFDKRLGLANAIGATGEGIGGLIFPPLYTFLLEEYGWRGTLLLLSGFILNCFVCAVVFIPPEFLKASSKGTSQKSFRLSSCGISFGFIKKPSLVLHLLSMAISFLGFIVPFVHLPDLAVQIGIEKYRAAYLISIMGVSSVVGRLFFGWVCDFQCTNIMFVQSASLMVCGIVTAICPHLTEFYALGVYSAIFGTFNGTYVSLMPLVSRRLVGLESTGEFFGLMLFFGAIFSIFASPFAGWLFDKTKTYDVSFYVAGGVFFLSGALNMVVMVLHRHQKNQKTEETVPELTVPTVSQSHINRNQESQNVSSLEQTYM